MNLNDMIKSIYDTCNTSSMDIKNTSVLSSTIVSTPVYCEYNYLVTGFDNFQFSFTFRKDLKTNEFLSLTISSKERQPFRPRVIIRVSDKFVRLENHHMINPTPLLSYNVTDEEGSLNILADSIERLVTIPNQSDWDWYYLSLSGSKRGYIRA